MHQNQNPFGIDTMRDPFSNDDAELHPELTPMGGYGDHEQAGAEEIAPPASAWPLVQWADPGAFLPPWHAVVRFDPATERLRTAIFPLGVFLRWYWRAVVTFRMGGHEGVPVDAREAFHVGMLTGAREERENGPAQLQADRAIVDGLKAQADKLTRYAAVHGLMLERQLELDEKVGAFLETYAGAPDWADTFPVEDFRKLRTDRAAALATMGVHADLLAMGPRMAAPELADPGAER